MGESNEMEKVTEENAYVGMRVRTLKDSMGNGFIDVITKNTCTVKWDNGDMLFHSIGKNDKYELFKVTTGSEKVSEVQLLHNVRDISSSLKTIKKIMIFFLIITVLGILLIFFSQTLFML